MGWLITLGILLVLGLIPLGVSAVFDEDGALVRVIAGPVKIQVFPSKQNKKKSRKEKSPSEKKKSNKSAGTKTAASKENKKGGALSDFLPLVNVLLKFLNGLRKKLRVNVLTLKLIMAADDPCDLAVNYGKAWAVVGNLMPQLERVFVIKKRNVEVECDFTADKTRVLAKLDITITLGRLLVLTVVLIVRAVVELIKIFMKRKGGAVNEPKSS